MFYQNFLRLCGERQLKPNNVTKALGLSTAAATDWKNGCVPRDVTLQKIADYFGVSVDYLLGNEKSETKKTVIRVPVYGQVAAGIPIDAIEDIEDYEELDANQYPTGDYIALKIHGRSMEPRMLNGDVVIVRLQDDVDNGEIAIVMVNGGEATCKKIKKTTSGIFLVSLNPSYEPVFYSNEEITSLPIKILGRVVELRGKF